MIPFVSRADLAEQKNWIKHLSSAMPNEVIVPFADLTAEQKQLCEIAIVANPDPKDLLSLPLLKWVHSVWAGVERMINELSSPSFSIVRLVDSNLAETMSEAVLAWTLFLHRDMPRYAKQQTLQSWVQQPMVRAQDRRIGVLGLGELGRVSAQRLVANGFSVAGWSRNPKQVEGVECFHGEEGLIPLLNQSDILVCLLPLTMETKGLLNHQNLSCLPVGASMINFARGPIIDDEALLAKLDQGDLSHAVLDVFMQEPLPINHSFWLHDSITVLPHISAPTHPVSASEIVATNIKQYRLTGNIPPAVDLLRGY
ncbi:2-hydroxyacid dehydrogenase [Marinomonas polaris]|uniref:2-hydroxyacid dehydrogenase n=1 Tax=Marinomonas polaris TaxID=293552 RepID=UPI0035138041